MKVDRKAGRRAVSSVIGGVFVLLIIVVGLLAFLYVSGLEDNVHTAQNSAALIDTEKNQERLNVLNALFGGTQSYNPSSSYVSTGSCVNVCGITMTTGNAIRYDSKEWCASSSSTGCGSTVNYTRGTLEPGYAPMNLTSQTTTGSQQMISNMNFTNSISGWVVYTTSNQVIGGFASTQGNGIPGSGIGSMFIGASFISGSQVSGNESTEFYVDPTSTGTGTLTGAGFSFAEFFSQSAFSNAALNNYVYNIYLVDKTNGTNYLMWTSGTISEGDKADTQWNYHTAITNFASGGRNGAGVSIYKALVHKGFYQVVIQTILTFKNGNCGDSCTQFFGYFDDVGLAIQYSSFVTDWTYTFDVAQTPTSVKTLAFQVTSSYNQSNVLQYIYLYDWVLGKYDLFSTTTASTQPTSISLTVNVTNTGQFSAQNLVSQSGLVRLRMYSVRPSSVLTGALGDNMEVDISSVNGLAITISYASQNAFTLVLQNGGPQPIEIVSLVIIDSNGHSFLNSSGALLYNGVFNSSITFDRVIYPLQTISVQVNYKWVSGIVSYYFLTSRGNVFTSSTMASS